MSNSSRDMTRRDALRRSAQLAVGAAMSSTLAPLFASPQSRWFKIGACDWLLEKRADPAALDVAKQIGLDGIMIDLGTVASNMHVRKPAVQQAYREAVQRTGLEIASLALCDLNEVPLKSDPRAAKWLADSIDVCVALKVPITMSPFFGKGELDMAKTQEIDQVVKILKEIAPRAERHGVIIGLENLLSAEENMKIIDRVGSPAVKVYYDIGNSAFMGRDIGKEIRTLGKLICEFHAKEGSAILGEGRIDFHTIRKAIDDIGYSGWILIESTPPHNLIADYKLNHKFLKSVFPSRL